MIPSVLFSCLLFDSET